MNRLKRGLNKADADTQKILRELSAAMHSAALEYGKDMDVMELNSLIMTAACMIVGVNYATGIGLSNESDTPEKREQIIKMFLANFDAGFDFGSKKLNDFEQLLGKRDLH